MNDWNNRIEVSKLDAIRRQLLTAVELYFTDGDYVSIHALAAAAYDVCKDILINANGSTGMLLQFEHEEDPKRKKEIRDHVRSIQNFFKHADNDPDINSVISYSPAITELLLYECCAHFYRHDPRGFQLCAMYVAWYCAWHPEFRVVHKDQTGFTKFEVVVKNYAVEEKQRFYLDHWARLTELNLRFQSKHFPDLCNVLDIPIVDSCS
jgi:hypothetical protein